VSRRIIITGITGFVGSSLVKYFSKLDYTILGISRNKPSPEIMGLLTEWYQADLSIQCPKLICDTVIHCAGLASDSANTLDHFTHNTRSTQITYDALICKQFIFISSASVYENMKGELKEDVVNGSNCVSAYARSKYQAEQFLLSQNMESKRVVILRPRAIYGPNDSVLLPKLLKLSIAKRIQLVMGNAEFNTSLTHIVKLSKAIEQFIMNHKQGIYNVCDDQTYFLKNVLLDIHEFKTGKKPFQLRLNVTLLRAWVNLSERFKIKSSLSTKSIQYLTEPCVLNIDKLKTEFPLLESPGFSRNEL